MTVVKRDKTKGEVINEIQNHLSTLQKRADNRHTNDEHEQEILFEKGMHYQQTENILSQSNKTEKTTCKTTVGDLHNKPIEKLLTTTNDQLYHIRINLEQEHYPKYSHMWI